jgi:hypothetical protein
MNLVELQHALRQLRCSGMAAGLEARLLQAQAEQLPPLDCLSHLVQDELVRRQDRLLERRLKQAGFRDVGKRLDTFDFEFNKKMPRAIVFELATARWITQHADALFLGAPGTGKSHLAQAIGFIKGNRNPLGMFTGLIPALELARHGGQLVAWYSFWPLGWVLTIGQTAVDGAADVSSWFHLGYMDKASSTITLPLQFAYEFPGDFRRPEELPEGKWRGEQVI